jgi:hypothetical protein
MIDQAQNVVPTKDGSQKHRKITSVHFTWCSFRFGTTTAEILVWKASYRRELRGAALDLLRQCRTDERLGAKDRHRETPLY